MTGHLPTAEFGELPPMGSTRPRTTAWIEVAEKLRAHPGQWAKVITKDSAPSATNAANAIKGGRLTAFRPVGAFEAVTRGCDVWARFVGGTAVTS